MVCKSKCLNLCYRMIMKIKVMEALADPDMGPMRQPSPRARLREGISLLGRLSAIKEAPTEENPLRTVSLRRIYSRPA